MTFTHRISAERLIAYVSDGSTKTKELRGLRLRPVPHFDSYDAFATTRRRALILAVLSIPRKMT